MTPLIKQASDHSLLVSFGEGISIESHLGVRKLSQLLLSDKPAHVRNLHPAYNSLLISFDPGAVAPEGLESHVWSLLDLLGTVTLPEAKHVEIPVVYGGPFGPDLHDVASHNRITEEDVVQIHTAGEYRVYFLGFSPGFPYMGGMPEQIAMPRLPTPRTSVPPGSVAIGGNQTGVYPVSSPGGWRIIGRTPLSLFDVKLERPAFLGMGDLVRFRKITSEEFDRIKES